jgi:hypothetical protein
MVRLTAHAKIHCFTTYLFILLIIYFLSLFCYTDFGLYKEGKSRINAELEDIIEKREKNRGCKLVAGLGIRTKKTLCGR